MPLLFKNYSLAEVPCWLIRFNKTKFFPWNTKNSDRNGINKENTHAYTPNNPRKIILERASMKKSNNPLS